MTARDPMGFDKPPFSLPPEVRDGEPESLVDSWPFLACLALIVCAILWARSQGWIA